MSNLVIIQNNQTVTTSKMVAEAFEKRHADVLRDISNLDCSDNFRERNFALSLIINKLSNNLIQKDKTYNITRDGFTFLAMGYTGKRAAEFKEAYIKAFNDMEQKLQDQKFMRNCGFQIEDFIIAQSRSIIEQAQSIIDLKNKVRVIEETTDALNDAAMKKELTAKNEHHQIPELSIDEAMFTVREYTTGKILDKLSKAKIGIWARKYSDCNQLPIIKDITGNKYLPAAIEYGVSILSGSTDKIFSIPDPAKEKIIEFLKRSQLAQDIKKIPMGSVKSYRSSMSSKLKDIIYNKIHKCSSFRFSIITQTVGWVKIRRIS